MTPAEGDWVAEHILPKHVIDGAGGLALLRKCACQYGECGACRVGQCDRCSHALHPEWSRRPQPEAVIVRGDGGVVAEVWTGQGCRWRCTCPGRPVRDAWTEPESYAGVVQPSLFEAVT